MRPYRLFTIALLCAGALLVACDKKTEGDSKVLATVNGQKITEAEFQQFLALRQQREPITDKSQEKKVLDEMIDRVLLAQRAEKEGVDKDAEVRGVLARVRENILVQAMVRKMLKDSPITDADLKQRYEKEAAETHKTEYLVRHILTKNEDEAKEVIAQLNSKRGNFSTIAKQKSIDVQSGNNGGSLGWVNQGMVVPEFFAGVTRLQKGATSTEPVKSDFGWHVIKVEDTRPAKIPTYEEFIGDRQTKANFYRKLQDEKIEKTVKELRANAKIDIKSE